MSTRGSRTWRRTRTWLGSFFKLQLEAIPAEAAPPRHRLERRQLLAPAVFIHLAAAESRAAARAVLGRAVLHGDDCPPFKDLKRRGRPLFAGYDSPIRRP